MKFRKLSIALLAIVTCIFCWDIYCTWKVTSIRKEIIVNDPSLENSPLRLEAELSKKTKIPILGSEVNLQPHAIKWDRDLAGGWLLTVTVYMKRFMLEIMKKKEGELDKVFEETFVASKDYEDTPADYIRSFCHGLNKRRLDVASYFEGGGYGVSATDGYAQVAAKLVKVFEDKKKRIYEVLKERLNVNNGGGVEVTSGDGVFYVTISGGKNPADIKQLIHDRGELKAHKVINTGSKEAKVTINALYNKLKEEDSYKGVSKNDLLKPTRLGYMCKELDKDAVKKAAEAVLANTDERREHLFFARSREDVEKGWAEFYLIEDSNMPQLEFAQREDALKVERNEKGSSYISVKLNETSSKAFGDFTKQVIDEKGQGQQPVLAMVLDDLVVLAASLKTALTQGQFVIEGFTQNECYEIVRKLKSGALPLQLGISEEQAISATLGEKAKQSGFISILIALLLILLLMAIYYAIGGLVANAALLFNILFILGTLAQFGTPLSLPGIASILLTLGMAVDANIIIFSGARAALEEGKNSREAIREGYRRAYKSLLDSNVTTLLAGIILWFFGTTTIVSFATTLIIGLLTSLITSVFVTRLLFDLLFAIWGPRANIKLSFSFTRIFQHVQVDLVGKRKFGYLFSAVFLMVGMGVLYQYPLTRSTELTGGKRYEVSFANGILGTGEQLTKEYLTDVFRKDGFTATVQEAGSSRETKFIIIAEKVDVAFQDFKAEVVRTLERGTGKKLTEDEAKIVGKQAFFKIDKEKIIKDTTAKKTRRQSLLAVLFALLGMLLYIFVSFSNLGFALAALVALVHDIMAIFACIGIANLFVKEAYELDLTLLICALTIFGYSINDTILFFISLVKQIPDKDTSNIRPYINRTLAITFERIFMTSLSTALPLVILFFFGGAGLRTFSFSLLCGVAWGTYSSIMATPLAYDINRGLGFIKRKLSKGDKKPNKVASKATPINI